LEWMREHPCITVGAAFAAGFILHKLVTREPGHGETPTKVAVHSNGATQSRLGALSSLLSAILLQLAEAWLKREPRSETTAAAATEQSQPPTTVPDKS
jgi:hypothetical protein